MCLRVIKEFKKWCCLFRNQLLYLKKIALDNLLSPSTVTVSPKLYYNVPGVVILGINLSSYVNEQLNVYIFYYTKLLIANNGWIFSNCTKIVSTLLRPTPTKLLLINRPKFPFIVILFLLKDFH